MVRGIVIICGPTASGKTQIGIRLAGEFDGEIVSADSQQVWRGFDIGTAKADLKGRSGGLHHLIDVADPAEHFDAATFVKLADGAIEAIASRGKNPFVVGGTGMYIRMLEKGICEAPPKDDGFRAEMGCEIEAGNLRGLYDDLKRIDPSSAADIHPNDRTRIIRALEIYHLAGVAASEFRKTHAFSERRYRTLKVGLNVDRGELYRRIDERVERMMSGGLVDEVRSLLSSYGSGCQPFSAVGYREIVSHLRGELSYEEALDLTKRNSRRFAKRQLTWFRADPEVRWHHPDDYPRIRAEVDDFLLN